MKKNKNENNLHHLLMYVEDCDPKIKKFKTMKDMEKFVNSFRKQYPENIAPETGYWIDYAVTGVTGDVHFFVDGIDLS